MHQSLVFGKPQLVIPSETDTFDAGARVVDAGAGLQIDYKTINAKVVAATTFAILTLHDKYAAASKKVGQILLAAGTIPLNVLHLHINLFIRVCCINYSGIN